MFEDIYGMAKMRFWHRKPSRYEPNCDFYYFKLAIICV